MLTRAITAAIAGTVTAGLIAAPAAAVSRTADQRAATFPSGALVQLVSDLVKAQTLSTGRGVTVAVISTGVDPSDPALTGKVSTGPDYASKPNIPLSHEYGTVVASIIAGSGPSGSRPLTALGVAPDARILSIRAYPQSNEPGSGPFFQSADYNQLNAKAIRYAVSHGAQVIYVEEDDQINPGDDMWTAVAEAVAKNVVIVAPEAAYGSSPDSYAFPAGLPGVIGVASVRLNGGTAPYDKARSGQNNAIMITGPGNSMNDTSGWEVDGPGAAAAVVAGTVALIKSLYPGLSVAQVERVLATSARYHPRGGYSTAVGFGLVNPDGALHAAAALPRSGAGGPAGVAANARLASGPPPAMITAVHHASAKLTGYFAAIAVGLILLVTALIVVLRRRRRRTPVPA